MAPATEAAPLVLVPASFLNYSGDVSWEFLVPGRGAIRAGVRLAARRRIQRELRAEEAATELRNLAAAALLEGSIPPDPAGVVWVTPAHLDRLRAVVRAWEARALPLYREGLAEEVADRL